MGAVSFLTCGQRCWDWFILRHGHVASSVASSFMSLATRISKRDADSVSLRQLMDSAPQCLIDAWHGTWSSDQYATGNNAAIRKELHHDTFVTAVFEAGLAESKAEPWLATSPDAIGGVDFGALTPHLQRASMQVLASDHSVQHVPFVYKTFAKANRVKYEDIADTYTTNKGWQACSMDSPLFKVMVPNTAYRRQLIHSVATFRAQAIVFVAANERADGCIISKTLVIASAAVVAKHVAVLKAMATQTLDWVNAGAQRAPRWFDPRAAQLLESFQEVWWATRMKVYSDGPMHPVETLRLAPVVLHNKYVVERCTQRLVAPLIRLRCGCMVHSTMVRAGGFDRFATSVRVQIAQQSNSYQQPLMFSMLLKCIGNCLACWRLAAREHDLEAASWPGLPLYTRFLRASITSEMFVVNLASGLLAHRGKAPLPIRTTVGGPGSDAAAAGVGGDDTDESIGKLKAKLDTIKQGKARRVWFASEHGKRFRSYRSHAFSHAAAHSSKPMWCHYCSRTIAVPSLTNPARSWCEKGNYRSASGGATSGVASVAKPGTVVPPAMCSCACLRSSTA